MQSYYTKLYARTCKNMVILYFRIQKETAIGSFLLFFLRPLYNLKSCMLLALLFLKSVLDFL